jgi:hypothetical protein
LRARWYIFQGIAFSGIAQGQSRINPRDGDGPRGEGSQGPRKDSRDRQGTQGETQRSAAYADEPDFSCRNDRAVWPYPLGPWPERLTPWPESLTPWPEHLTPWPEPLTPWPEPLTPWPKLLTPWPKLLTPWPEPLTPWPESLTPWPERLTPWLERLSNNEHERIPPCQALTYHGSCFLAL